MGGVPVEPAKLYLLVPAEPAKLCLLVPVEPARLYAHIEVVVTFLVVNFFGFSKITRYHGGFEGRH